MAAPSGARASALVAALTLRPVRLDLATCHYGNGPGTERMRTTPIACRSTLCLGLALSALGGCGGGGGSDTPQSPSGDANPAGVWQGTFTAADGTRRGFDIIMAPDGQFVGIIASSGLNGRFIIGSGDTTSNMFSATGTVFPQAGEAPLLPNGQPSDVLTVTNGNIVQGVSLGGSYSGGGESGSFLLGYNGSGTARGASLAAIGGVYDIFPPPLVSTATVVINGGTLTFAADGGCNGAGTIAVIDPRLNMYTWTMLISACSGAPEDTMSGLATLADNPRGGTANLVALYGATATRDRSFVFRGSK